ncbi:response regulator transcription factor [Streptomyces sp. ZAF1911]|uniref:response regulator transcription factor n=1 Tax=Streptomyces sp. ZAF1911 TaxID=2944129 RepID=UPI00237C35D0|nr:response regulator transcription factor [Streptomyces sp. ZAF1911]MDD9375839.1 response regulator transcription factor [Streptomyces sp. ZAF1911]
MRIVVAEDAAVVREGLVQLLRERGLDVVAAVGDADALIAAVEEQRPDVVVADIRMPPTHRDDGLRAALKLRERFPDLGVLLFSQYIETRYADRLATAGLAGLGYLLKERVADIDEFVGALRRVADGGTALDPEVVSQLLAARRTAEALAPLTAREREVLSAMAEGRTNAAIADVLDISRRAVEKHTAAIFDKLGLPRTETQHRRVLAVLHYLDRHG